MCSGQMLFLSYGHPHLHFHVDVDAHRNSCAQACDCTRDDSDIVFEIDSDIVVSYVYTLFPLSHVYTNTCSYTRTCTYSIFCGSGRRGHRILAAAIPKVDIPSGTNIEGTSATSAMDDRSLGVLYGSRTSIWILLPLSRGKLSGLAHSIKALT